MVKLERIHLKNYKNIAEADLNLGQINVIVGENNAGKSNLLEVIPFLNYLINGPINEIKEGFEIIGGSFRKFNNVVSRANFANPIYPLTIEIDFNDFDRKIFYSYRIAFESGKKSEENAFLPILISNELLVYKNKANTGKAITIFHRNRNSVKYGDAIKKGAIISEVESHASVIRLISIIKNSENISQDFKGAFSSLEEVLSSPIFYLSPHLLKESRGEYENLNRVAYLNLDNEIADMEHKGYWTEYKIALKTILRIEEVNFAIDANPSENGHRKKTPIFKQNGHYKVRQVFSDGTLVLLALITKLFSGSSDIFLIEEPENSIHPRAFSELMKLIRKLSLDKQFIITTHSSYLLNMIRPEEVFVASINEDGTSKIGALPDIKAIKKKLAKGFMDFGDIVFDEATND